jgi:acetyl/propionyl-CoA carboxylase alpha subunit
VEGVWAEILKVKFQARFAEEAFEVSVKRLPELNGCQQLEIMIRNGKEERSYQVELLGRQKGRWTLRLDHAIWDFVISRAEGRSLVDWRNQLFPIEISDYQRQGLRRGGTQGIDGEVVLKAQMPGKIIRVLRKAGERVEEGEGVVVVEAMKMQNEITAPRQGEILSCDLEEGSSVSAGDVLFKMK